jgi:hypothetical protein
MEFRVTAIRGRTKERVELIIRAEDASQAERVAKLYRLGRIRVVPMESGDQCAALKDRQPADGRRGPEGST